MKRKSNFFKKYLVLGFLGILVLLISLDGVVAAEKFPTKPIKILVGYSPGGTSDLMARMLAGLVTEYLEQPILVVNKPGAAATIMVTELAGSNPDGYTLGNFTISTLSLTPFTVKVKYDPEKDVEPLLNYADSPYGICVRHDAPWKSYEELMDFARKNPGKLSISTTGVASVQHVAFEWIARKEQIKWKHVPYPGGAAAAAALLGGHVDVNFGSSSHAPFVESGKFRLLASYSSKRDPKHPEVPTLKELGYDMPITNANFIGAPKGVPEDVLKTLENAFTKAVKTKSFQNFLGKLLMTPNLLDRNELRELINSEVRGWSRILDTLNMKLK
jgi:tripartite-type tricarboxylate transporter receptor subunit TctC